jgi:hypothetical protein
LGIFRQAINYIGELSLDVTFGLNLTPRLTRIAREPSGDIPRAAVRHSDTDTWKCNSAFYATFRPERTSDSEASRGKAKAIIEGVEKKRM